jgi:hypothetical protein
VHRRVLAALDDSDVPEPVHDEDLVGQVVRTIIQQGLTVARGVC